MKKGFNLFQLNVDKVPGFDALGAEDFSPATAEERASMVENRLSVSYWRDAARRFKANRVSMAALFLFLLIFLFSYLGPLFIPYHYSDQYRASGKLGPGEHSKIEKTIQKAEGVSDRFFATSLITDWRVRAAITLCIDRNHIVENVTQGGQIPATSLVTGGITDSTGAMW